MTVTSCTISPCVLASCIVYIVLAKPLVIVITISFLLSVYSLICGYCSHDHVNRAKDSKHALFNAMIQC